MTEHERLQRLVVAEGDDGEGALDRRLGELDDLDVAATVEMEADLETLSALANPTRYHVVRLLAETDELTVAELDAILEVSQSAVSHALAELSEAGLVERRRDGTWRYYRTSDRATRIVEALAATRA